MPASNDSRVRVDWLVEQHRDRLRALERPARERRGLQRVREVEHLGLLGRA